MSFVDTYAPIIIAKESSQITNGIDDFLYLKNGFIKAGCKVASDMTEDDYIHFVMSDAFLNPNYNGKYKELNHFVINHSDFMLAMLNSEDFNNGKEKNIIAEFQDIYLFPILLSKWIKNKQVYKPDSDFANALISTETCEITREMIEHLPCNNIYIDLLDCEAFKPIDGMLLNVITNDNGIQLAIYLLERREDNVIFFSFYIGGEYDDNDVVSIDFKRNLNVDEDFYIFPIVDNPNILAKKVKYNYTRAQMSLFGVQILAYITSKEPQIEESEVTKHTYRKPNSSSKVKNKFSEVQMWDVGVKYGKSYRNTFKQLKAGNGGFTLDHKRKSPIPHFRRAHWQRFWVGKGRTKVINKWIAPTFVNGEFAKDINIKDIK